MLLLRDVEFFPEIPESRGFFTYKNSRRDQPCGGGMLIFLGCEKVPGFPTP